MTQIEFDAAMKQFNHDQMLDNQIFNENKEAIDLEINDCKLQIEELRTTSHAEACSAERSEEDEPSVA